MTAVNQGDHVVLFRDAVWGTGIWTGWVGGLVVGRYRGRAELRCNTGPTHHWRWTLVMRSVMVSSTLEAREGTRLLDDGVSP